MSTVIRVAQVEDIPLGEGRSFAVGGRRVAVFRPRVGGIYATQAECPHKNGPLADGLVGGTTVICPLHDRTYDLTTGAVLVGECNIAVYPVRVEDGAVLVSVPVAEAVAL
jgi:nitrite reductase (NADH) small subunit